jgi:hypothetical protein
MKNFTLINILAIAAVVSACGKTEPTNEKIPMAAPAALELKVINWGPQSAKIGSNPNKQPDGSMGIWIETSGTQGLGEAQVLFAGQPGKLTAIQEKIITTAISIDQIAVLGDKDIIIKQVGTGKLYPIGIFKVTDK